MLRRYAAPIVVLLSVLKTSPSDAATCIEFYEAERVAAFESDAISESSGLAVSRSHSGLLWTHNDSGDEAQIYALNQSGVSQGIIKLSNATARDWEAMALGPCGTSTCIVVGDVGDNNAIRDDVALWRLPEPSPTGPGTSQITTAEELRIQYPDGPQDCEGIAIDPLTGDTLLVEKSMTAKARTYLVALSDWEEETESPLLVQELDTIDFDTDSLTGGLVTGIDIAPSGTELFVRTYVAGFHVPLVRDATGRIAGYGEPRLVSVFDEGQCEAVAYNGDGLELWFTCEDENGPIARATCKTIQDDDTGTTTTIDREGCDCSTSQSPLLAVMLLMTWFYGRSARRPSSAN